MSRIALDLKQFKHIRSDKDTTTLKHKDGHELTLAHNALSPEYRKQLGALSKVSSEDQTADQANEARQNFEGGGIINPKLSGMQKAYDGPAASPAPAQQAPKTPTSDRIHELEAARDNLGRPMNDADKTEYNQLKAKQAEGMAEGGTVGNPKLEESKKVPPNYGKVTVIPDKPQPMGKILDKAINGKKPKVYAEGPADGMVGPNDGTPTTDAAPQMQDMLKPQMPQAAEPEKVAPILQATRDKYNQLAGATPGDPSAPMVDPGMFTFGVNGEPPKAFKPDIWEQAEQQVKAQAEGQQSAKLEQTADVSAQNAVRARAGLPALPQPPMPPSATAAMEGENSTSPQPVQNPVNGSQAEGMQQQPSDSGSSSGIDTSNPEAIMQSGYNQKLSGISGVAEATGALGKEQANVLNKNIESQQQAQSAYQNTYNELEQERQNHMYDIVEGHIDPDKYWKGWTDSNGNEHAGHSKIAAGIGMILAGFNPTSNPNAAIGYLKNQMDMNIEAQKSNLNSEHNLLAANLKQFGNLRDATDMTRLMQNDIMQHKLLSAAATAQTAQAKAAAQQAAGQLKMDAAPIFQNFAMRRAMIGLASNPNQNPQAIDHMLGYMRATNPEMAKEMESRYVPGIGLGSTPIPDGTRQQIATTKSVNDLMNMSLQFSKQHSGTLSPSLRAQAATIQNQLVGAIKQAQHDGVYKPSEAEFLTSQIGGSPASFVANLSSVPKIRELQSIKQAEYNNLLSTYGLPKQQLTSAAPGSDGPVKGKDGKMYVRQGNYYVPYQGK